jgi:serine/threonine protein kinase
MDLKPENILLTSTDKPTLKVAGINKIIKILFELFFIQFIDFGVAQHIGKQGSRSIRGTLMYMAPEILLGPYDNRVDLWSIGVILYGNFVFE